MQSTHFYSLKLDFSGVWLNSNLSENLMYANIH